MRPSTRLLAGAAALLVMPTLVAGCGRDAPPSSLVGTTTFAPDERAPMPPISGTTADGTRLDLADNHGKVVVLNSWASWCAPCRDEIGGFVALSKAADPADVAVVGLNVKDDPAAAADFAKEFGLPYPSIVDAEGTLLPTIPGVPPASLPSTVIVDREGRIAATIVGPADQTELSTLVESVVTEEG